MGFSDFNELLDLARDEFVEGNYNQAENMLHQILLKDNRNPEVFQMLATIYYDRGKFNKAIKTFKRALEIDPNYTDASVGLSIILNDLGRYEEGQDVFYSAQKRLKQRKQSSDPFIEKKISQKHMELGDLYFSLHKYEEALEEFQKSRVFSESNESLVIKLAETLFSMNQHHRAISELKKYVDTHSSSLNANLKLGEFYYQKKNVAEAIDAWERVLDEDPNHSKALSFLFNAKEQSQSELTP